MPLYHDSRSIINTEHIVSAHLCDGQGELDGWYTIAYLLDVGGTPKRVWVEYRSEQERNTAFAALCALLDAGVVGEVE